MLRISLGALSDAGWPVDTYNVLYTERGNTHTHMVVGITFEPCSTQEGVRVNHVQAHANQTRTRL